MLRNLRFRLLGCLFGLAVASQGLAQDIDPATGAATPYPGTPVTGYKLAWSDEFNATTLSTTRWNYRTDTRFWSLQRSANVRLASGLLNLDLKKETFGTTNYTGGGVISKTLFRYGYYEARMKVPPGGGWHTSFWMMKYNRPATDTVAIELDAIENDSVTPLKYGVNTHRHLPTPHLTYGSKTITTPSLSAGFNVVACEFTPSVIRYFFNGAVVQTVDATQFPHGDLNIWLTSIAAPLGGTTSVDDTQLPSSAQFDYVRYFAPGPVATVTLLTPGSAGVTLSSTDLSLRVAASATSSDPALTPVIQWSKFSGPGEAVFANPAAADTTVRFSTPGTYVLQCQATVSDTPSAARLSVGVAAPVPATFTQSFDAYQHIATFIRGDSPDWNSGARDQLIVGRWGGVGMRMLFSFSLAGLPSDAVIEGADLDLWTSTVAGTGTVEELQLRPLLSTPVEGTGTGTSATDGSGTGATWSSRTGGTASGDLWTTPGGDIGTDILASVPGYDATLTSRRLTFSGTAAFAALAESARASATPLNFAALSPSLEASSVNAISRIASDDNSEAAVRPRLTVYYRGNYVPNPFPGPPPSAVPGVAAALSGSAPGATSVRWTQVSGPAAVVFANPVSAATSATFPVAGSYMLALSATNARAETSATLAVNVAQPLTPIESWRTANFGAAAPSGDAADIADPDGDGVPNLLEFALGGQPLSAASAPLPAIARAPGTSSLTLDFTRSLASIRSVVCVVEWTDDLAAAPAVWSSAGVVLETLSADTTKQQLRATIPLPDGLPARFVRLRATLAP